MLTILRDMLKVSMKVQECATTHSTVLTLVVHGRGCRALAISHVCSHGRPASVGPACCPLGVLDRGDDGPHLGIALIDLQFISGLPQMACRAFELGLCGASQTLGDECVSLPGDFIGTGGFGHAVSGACGVGAPLVTDVGRP